MGAASANELQPFQAVQNTDWAQAGRRRPARAGHRIDRAGRRDAARVTQAYLYWAGPTDLASPAANASVTFAGAAVTGTNIGVSFDNFWGFLNSQAYRADVTSLVTGNGAYSLANLVKPNVEVNGASLVVFFNDGNAANNQERVPLQRQRRELPQPVRCRRLECESLPASTTRRAPRR